MDDENKKELYEKSIQEIKERLKDIDEDNVVSKMATISAVLKNTIPYYFWCGFYFAEEKEMVVGPYQGTCACPNIKYSGVCGSSANKKETIVVEDVHDFPGHITCDDKSNSEIVVPLMDNKGRVIAVFDVDSTEINSFNETDTKFLEEIMKLIL